MKFPVSYHQQRMWFIDHFERDYLYEGGPVYHNIPLSFTIEKEVRTEEIYRAFLQLMNRHDILRTKIVRDGDQIFQMISTPEEVEIEKFLVETSCLKENQEVLRKNSFDFENELLVKAFFEHHKNKTSILFLFHHAIVDRVSLKILKEEFLILLEGAEVHLNFTMQYKDFSEWQKGIDPYEIEMLVVYWRKQLSDLQVLHLPTYKERLPIHIYEAATSTLSFSKERLQNFALNNGITAQIVTLAVFKMALASLSGISDIVIGTLMNMRNLLTEETVGPIENLVVLRSVLEKNINLSEACIVVDKTWQAAVNHKGIPFDKLVVEINPKKDMSRTALFDVLFLYEPYDVFKEEKDEPSSYKNQGLGKYDFNLLVQEKEKTFDFILTYNHLYFKTETIESFLLCIKNILDSATRHQDLDGLRGVAVF